MGIEAKTARGAVLTCLALAFSLALQGCTRKKTIWVYTSLPKEAIEEMLEPLAVQVPQAEVRWYQNTSEAVAARLRSELAEGKPKADLLVTGDPVEFEDLKAAGRLLAYQSPAVQDVPSQWLDPQHFFATVRIPVIVLAYNAGILKPGELPERWKDLADPKWAGKVSMPNPLDSASAFLALSQLARTFGWEYFGQLRRLGLVAEGSNGSVMARLETGDRPVGIVQLDAVLRAEGRKQPIKPIYPLDGAIAVPGPIAILKSSENPEVAKKVYDWFFSPQAQTAIVHTGMYSPVPRIVSPDGARPWSELSQQLVPWKGAFFSEIHSSRDQVRAKFSEIVLH